MLMDINDQVNLGFWNVIGSFRFQNPFICIFYDLNFMLRVSVVDGPIYAPLCG